MSPTASYLVETLVTLVVVCGLAFVVLYGARRLGIGRARGPIQLVGQLPLDARRAIYLVRVGGESGQVIVVGVGEGGFTKLGEMAAGDLAGVADTAASAPFADVLARVLRRAPETAPESSASSPSSSPSSAPATATDDRGGP